MPLACFCLSLPAHPTSRGQQIRCKMPDVFSLLVQKPTPSPKCRDKGAALVSNAACWRRHSLSAVLRTLAAVVPCESQIPW